MTNLRLAILIIGTLNVLAGGVNALPQATGVSVHPTVAAVAYLVSITTVFLLAQLQGWKQSRKPKAAPHG